LPRRPACSRPARHPLADRGTLELLEHLVSLFADVPLMVMATSRGVPDGNDQRFRERVRREHAARTLELGLGPLDVADAEDLVSQLAPGELAPDARREVIALAEGNPR